MDFDAYDYEFTDAEIEACKNVAERTGLPTHKVMRIHAGYARKYSWD